jgi:hypothetical protein
VTQVVLCALCVCVLCVGAGVARARARISYALAGYWLLLVSGVWCSGMCPVRYAVYVYAPLVSARGSKAVFDRTCPCALATSY